VKKNKESRIWVIRPGRKASPSRSEEIERMFVQNGIAGLCDDLCVGDIRKFGQDRLALRASISSGNPDLHPSAVSSVASNLLKIAHEMQMGDWVLCPSRIDKIYRVGIVRSAYQFDTKSTFQHARNVKWILEIEKSSLSIQAQRELGAARLFFECRRFAHEVKSRLSALNSPGNNVGEYVAVPEHIDVRN